MLFLFFGWGAGVFWAGPELHGQGLPPLLTIREFLQRADGLNPTNTVRIRGAVTLHSRNGPVFIQDQTGGLFARGITNAPLSLGELLEVTGRVNKDGYSPTLQDCVYRSLGGKRVVPPKLVPGAALRTGAFDMQLVELHGRLLTEPTRSTSSQVLQMEVDHVLVTVELESAREGNLVSQLRPASYLQAIGVCSVGGSRGHPPTSLRIKLRSESDVHVLAPPPWWTPERALRIAWVALAFGVAGLGWILALRHQVRKQTDQIQARVRAEALLEEQYRRIIETALEGIVLLDGQGRIRFANRHLADMLQAKPENLLDRQLLDFVVPAKRDEAQIQLRANHREAVGRSFDLPLCDTQGNELWVSVATSSFADETGQARTLAMMANVTERRLMERKTLELNQLLEKRVRERTTRLQETIAELEQYSYSISHDMRGPLRAMNQFSSIVLEDYGDKLGPQGRDYLQRIATAAGRLDQLIQDVLNYSRLAREELPLGRVHLETLLEESINHYPMLASAQLEVQRPLLPVLGNEAALTQCLANLLGNAVKFVAPGVKPQVRVWSERRGPMVRVSVEDNGIGIDPRYQDQIWGIFQRLHTSEAYEGTGIGLSIVKKSVERMGGRVGLDSTRGKGSRFWFELAAAEDNLTSDQARG